MSSDFQDLVEQDIAEAFLDEECFASRHTFDGKEILCVCDDASFSKHAAELGVQDSGVRLFVESIEVGSPRRAGDSLEFDGELYEIEEWLEDMGVATITLRANMTAY